MLLEWLRRTSCAVVGVGVLLSADLGFAEPDAAADPATQSQSEMDRAYEDAGQAMRRGPAQIAVASQAKLDLPEHFGYVPQPQANRLLEAMGNGKDAEVQGLIYPTGDNPGNWFVVVSYTDSGYIRDDDAKDWDADELLGSIREGTEASNLDRRERGFAELEVIGWVEPPRYDAATHQMVWSISSRDKGQPDGVDQGINYKTLALGRSGYVSMNLVTDMREIEAQKPIAKQLLSKLQFDDGKRYADFNEETDHVAEYGLAAIVAGVAAKKLGFFAVAAAFFAKFAKVFIAGLIAIGAMLRKRLARNKG